MSIDLYMTSHLWGFYHAHQDVGIVNIPPNKTKFETDRERKNYLIKAKKNAFLTEEMLTTLCYKSTLSPLSDSVLGTTGWTQPRKC